MDAIEGDRAKWECCHVKQTLIRDPGSPPEWIHDVGQVNGSAFGISLSDRMGLSLVICFVFDSRITIYLVGVMAIIHSGFIEHDHSIVTRYTAVIILIK